MQQESAIAHIFAALARLSEQTIHQIFEEIPEQEKNQIVSLLCRENQDRMIDEHLGVCVEAGEIDYAGMIRAFLPMVQERLASSSDAAAALLQKLPLNNADVILRFMSQASKDAMVAYLLNANQEKICALAEQSAKEHGICLSVENLNTAV